MGTTVEKLNAILNTKENMKQKFNEKGVAVDDSVPFSEYPDKMDEMGGDSKIVSNNNAKVLQKTCSTSTFPQPQAIINTATAEITES